MKNALYRPFTIHLVVIFFINVHKFSVRFLVYILISLGEHDWGDLTISSEYCSRGGHRAYTTLCDKCKAEFEDNKKKSETSMKRRAHNSRVAMK